MEKTRLSQFRENKGNQSKKWYLKWSYFIQFPQEIIIGSIFQSEKLEYFSSQICSRIIKFIRQPTKFGPLKISTYVLTNTYFIIKYLSVFGAVRNLRVTTEFSIWALIDYDLITTAIFHLPCNPVFYRKLNNIGKLL